MSGNRIGGMKTARKILAVNPDHYKTIGQIGGQNGHTGGFAASPERARWAGAIGGHISSRAGIKTGQGKKYQKAVSRALELTEG